MNATFLLQKGASVAWVSRQMGKTTLAPFLLRDAFDLMEYVNADPIAQGLSGFHPQSVDFEAGRIMLGRVHTLAEHRSNFAFETTLANPAAETTFRASDGTRCVTDS